MSSVNVSNEVAEFLLADSGQCSFEILDFAPNKKDPKTIVKAIAILRCLHDPKEFLISSFEDIEKFKKDDQNLFAFTPEPVDDFLEFLDLERKDVAILDDAHIGPLSINKTMELLELAHHNFHLFMAHKKIQHAKKAFLATEEAYSSLLNNNDVIQFPGRS